MGNLVLDRVSKSYGARHALAGLGFEVKEGELFGFVGSNGAGKTTAMRIVLGVLAADSGEIRWDGAPIDDAVRRSIGYMPEERGLYPKMKVREQLVYLARLRGLSAAAARTSTDAWLERLGVAERADDEVQKLSLGNQQRVQLAAALVHDPKLLVLDEPFSGLDPVAVDVMSEVLKEKAAEGVPVVFSSHQLDLVERLCDRVGIVRAGRLVALGSVAELREGGEARLVVRVADAAPDWASAVPGFTLDAPDTYAVAPDADDQALLRAALDAGRVTEFAWRRPTLTELFREAVAGEPTPEEEAA
ncbi:ATP-binding cassette domain-containing protein [Actinocorallia sp. A-T 12471]|uniref:ABC transporter ATP-binding protein n=1 Tax=Actinocorallia sp. A-T 12471 TaxID=3089813 RepID=UPI0029CD235F|nr:ATP-binding cassette domain-containing protein [Actinocorallia sp. A-T 12471]MDX6740364.1 ATP-binding cassette domain-containing protein [Actinocorallia sp. A-T 12471]